MAFGAGVTLSFKQELMKGTHDFVADTMKMALYTQSGWGSATPAGSPSTLLVYGTGGEVTGANYVAGGTSLTALTPSVSLSSTTAYVDWATDPSWSVATITADACLIYNNSTKNSTANRAIAIYSFGSTTSTAGTFTVVLPSPGASATLTIA